MCLAVMLGIKIATVKKKIIYYKELFSYMVFFFLACNLSLTNISYETFSSLVS